MAYNLSSHSVALPDRILFREPSQDLLVDTNRDTVYYFTMSSMFARANDSLSGRSAAEGLIAATSTASSSTASNSAAAKKLANRYTYSYPVYAVYLIVSFIFLATVINVTSVAYTRYLIRRRRILSDVSDSPTSPSDKEAEAGARLPLRTGRASIRLLPHAVLNFFRIAAFRATVPFGFGVYFTTAEVVIPAGYFIALMTFEFINCQSSLSHLSLQYLNSLFQRLQYCDGQTI